LETNSNVFLLRSTVNDLTCYMITLYIFYVGQSKRYCILLFSAFVSQCAFNLTGFKRQAVSKQTYNMAF